MLTFQAIKRISNVLMIFGIVIALIVYPRTVVFLAFGIIFLLYCNKSLREESSFLWLPILIAAISSLVFYYPSQTLDIYRSLSLEGSKTIFLAPLFLSLTVWYFASQLSAARVKNLISELLEKEFELANKIDADSLFISLFAAEGLHGNRSGKKLFILFYAFYIFIALMYLIGISQSGKQGAFLENLIISLKNLINGNFSDLELTIGSTFFLICFALFLVSSISLLYKNWKDNSPRIILCNSISNSPHHYKVLHDFWLRIADIEDASNKNKWDLQRSNTLLMFLSKWHFKISSSQPLNTKINDSLFRSLLVISLFDYSKTRRFSEKQYQYRRGFLKKQYEYRKDCFEKFKCLLLLPRICGFMPLAFFFFGFIRAYQGLVISGRDYPVASEYVSVLFGYIFSAFMILGFLGLLIPEVSFCSPETRRRDKCNFPKFSTIIGTVILSSILSLLCAVVTVNLSKIQDVGIIEGDFAFSLASNNFQSSLNVFLALFLPLSVILLFIDWVNVSKCFERGLEKSPINRSLLIVFAIPGVLIPVGFVSSGESFARFNWLFLQPLMIISIFFSSLLVLLVNFRSCLPLLFAMLGGKQEKITSKRYLGNFCLFLIFSAFICSQFDLNDNHKISLLGSRSTTIQPISTAFNTWLDQRVDNINKYSEGNDSSEGKKYPIYIVSAQGGGIYAAYHSVSSLSRLQKETSGNFSEHVFAISSTSGGSLGAGIFSSLVRLYDGDGGVLDRAKGLEYAFEYAWEKELKSKLNPFKESFYNQWKPKENVPALVMNTTIVETGEQLLISPFSMSLPYLKSIDCYRPDINLRLSTAVGLSARFPIVTPVGWFRGMKDGNGKLKTCSSEGTTVGQINGSKIRLADGGYFENSGVSTALAIGQELERVIKDRGLQSSIKIVYLAIIDDFQSSDRQLNPI